jgi:uncharacterized protein
MKKLFAVMPEETVQPLQYDCQFAIICFCPLPEVFRQYEVAKECQVLHFTHVPEAFMFGLFQHHYFVVLYNVYGASMGATVVEEIVHHGIRNIIGLGWVGTLTDQLPVGTNVVAKSTLVEMGTTPMYREGCEPDTIIYNYNQPFSQSEDLIETRVWTFGAFYKESLQLIKRAQSFLCDTVNMETSMFFAVCEYFGVLRYNYMATVSEVVDLEIKNDVASCITQVNSVACGQQTKLVQSILQFETEQRYIAQVECCLATVCRSHGADHAIAVMNHAKRAIEYSDDKLTTEQNRAVILAALLHDVDDRKLFKSSTNYQNARFMVGLHPAKFVDLVIELIRLVSCANNGDSSHPESWKLIPRYADRIEALGLVGIQRTHTFALGMGLPIINPETPRPADLQELRTIASPERFENYQVTGASASMIDHFYDKLLHLNSPKTTNRYLVQACRARHEIMEQFVLEFCRNSVDITEAFLHQQTVQIREQTVAQTQPNHSIVISGRPSRVTHVDNNTIAVVDMITGEASEHLIIGNNTVLAFDDLKEECPVMKIADTSIDVMRKSGDIICISVDPRNRPMIMFPNFQKVTVTVQIVPTIFADVALRMRLGTGSEPVHGVVPKITAWHLEV